MHSRFRLVVKVLVQAVFQRIGIPERHSRALHLGRCFGSGLAYGQIAFEVASIRPAAPVEFGRTSVRRSVEKKRAPQDASTTRDFTDGFDCRCVSRTGSSDFRPGLAEFATVRHFGK